MDPFDFYLAERLSMTREELLSRMTNYEYYQWQAFYNWRNEMEDLEIKKARGA